MAVKRIKRQISFLCFFKNRLNNFPLWRKLGIFVRKVFVSVVLLFCHVCCKYKLLHTISGRTRYIKLKKIFCRISYKICRQEQQEKYQAPFLLLCRMDNELLHKHGYNLQVLPKDTGILLSIFSEKTN